MKSTSALLKPGAGGRRHYFHNSRVHAMQEAVSRHMTSLDLLKTHQENQHTLLDERVQSDRDFVKMERD